MEFWNLDFRKATDNSDDMFPFDILEKYLLESKEVRLLIILTLVLERLMGRCY